VRKKESTWFTLGEAEKATGIRRTRLDHACRVGRVEYRRSESGARLLSHDVVEKLRKLGLRGFPLPYDPITYSNDQKGSSASPTLTQQRERIEQRRGDLEEMRVNLEVQRFKEQEKREKAERRAGEAAERDARAMEKEQAKLRRQQVRLEEARQEEARRQAAREAEAQVRRRNWEANWLDYALKLLPSEVPQSLELDVHQAVADLLPRIDADQPHQLTQRLIQAVIEKALQPWHRRKEIEKIIEQASNQLPVYARSWSSTPSEWDARAMRAAADCIAKLGDAASLAEIRATAVEAGNMVRAEYNAWKAGEDHRQACEQIVGWVFDGDDAREAVRQALDNLSIGATRTQMEKARDAALAPFRAAARAAADAERYLNHVASYIQKLGNEETCEWDLGDYFERHNLATKLGTKLRPLLIQKLLAETLDGDGAHRFIEEWLDGELELQD
jgi:hypothetical protein